MRRYFINEHSPLPFDSIDLSGEDLTKPNPETLQIQLGGGDDGYYILCETNALGWDSYYTLGVGCDPTWNDFTRVVPAQYKNDISPAGALTLDFSAVVDGHVTAIMEKEAEAPKEAVYQEVTADGYEEYLDRVFEGW